MAYIRGIRNLGRNRVGGSGVDTVPGGPRTQGKRFEEISTPPDDWSRRDPWIPSMGTQNYQRADQALIQRGDSPLTGAQPSISQWQSPKQPFPNVYPLEGNIRLAGRDRLWRFNDPSYPTEYGDRLYLQDRYKPLTPQVIPREEHQVFERGGLDDFLVSSFANYLGLDELEVLVNSVS